MANDTSSPDIPAPYRAWVYESANGKLTAIDLREETAYDIPPGCVWMITRRMPDGQILLNGESADACLPLDDFLGCVQRTDAWFAEWKRQRDAEEAESAQAAGWLFEKHLNRISRAGVR